MWTKRKTIFLLTFLLLIFSLAGCSSSQRQMDVARLHEPSDNQQDSSIIKRFEESQIQGQTAVESAIQLSQRYAKLSEDAVLLRAQNQSLLAENNHFKEQVADLEAKLKQAQTELNEANNLLIETRVELNNWKADVLGFRDEMRQAETAQLEALLQILKILLGGETTTESDHSKNENPVTVSAQGEPNE